MDNDIGNQVTAELVPYAMTGGRILIAIAAVLCFVNDMNRAAVACFGLLLAWMACDLYDIKRAQS